MRQAGMPGTHDALTFVHANGAWTDYQQKGSGWYRIVRSFLLTVTYSFMVLGIYYLITDQIGTPFIRGSARGIYTWTVWITFSLTLFLCFWTIDAARLCRWFIQCISEGPTRYPLATRKYFCQLSGGVPEDVLPDWVDVKIISQITERVGLLLYFPAVAFLILIMAHHTLWYDWPWPKVGYLIAICNFAVALASVVILQRAARRARDLSASNLEEKLNQLKAGTNATQEQWRQTAVTEGNRLLNEIRELNTGSFAGFWGNPVVGALLVPSSGGALLEIVRHFIIK
jgi:hypothetical protein